MGRVIQPRAPVTLIHNVVMDYILASRVSSHEALKCTG